MAHLQQIQFAETIRAMKRAMKRRADDSDSDRYIQAHTNRGHKLQREAKRVQLDRLGDADNLSYRKKIEHAGYTRTILAVNPPYVDDEGDLYSDASSDRDDLEPLEENPFDEVQIERLLRPLTSAAELPHHPTLSIPYQTKALTQMTAEAEEMLRRERANLWKAKRVLQRFRGDADWVPCGVFDSEDGDALLDGEAPAEETMSVVPSVAAISAQLEIEGATSTNIANDISSGNGHDEAAEIVKAEETTDGILGGAQAAAAPVDQAPDPAQPSRSDTGPNGDRADQMDVTPSLAHIAGVSEQDIAAASDAGSASNGTNTHAMTTRARARSPASNGDDEHGPSSPSPSDSISTPAVHPWFIAPQSSFPDRDLALPPPEAEEVRRFLLLYVQKQEQIVRSLEALYSGLQKAERLRTWVLRVCRAEAHVVPDGKGNMVTEMSDGEDWYDLGDWGMTPRDLKDGVLEKGKDEVEDVEEEGRKVRGRRRVNPRM